MSRITNSQTYRRLRDSNGRYQAETIDLEAAHEATAKKLYRRLLELDPENGEAWYDDDNNVPNYGSTYERCQILRRRIVELEK